MSKVIIAALPGIANPAALPPPKSIIIARLRTLLLLCLGVVTFASIAEQGRSSYSCERHQGSFTNDFSSEFDISTTDCAIKGNEDFGKISFFAVPPYVHIGR